MLKTLLTFIHYHFLSLQLSQFKTYTLSKSPKQWYSHTNKSLIWFLIPSLSKKKLELQIVDRYSMFLVWK